MPLDNAGGSSASGSRVERGNRNRSANAAVKMGGTARRKSRRGKQETIEDRKTALLAEKQAELESVVDRHDTFVREKFHMEKFRIMTAFNPKEAKEDDTPVFQEYKANYNLLDATASSVAGPSRRTRRAQTEHMQLLQRPSVSAPVRPAVSIVDKTKGHTPGNGAIWDILTSGKPKGKGKEKVVDLESTTGSRSDVDPGESISAAFVGRKSQRTRRGSERAGSMGPPRTTSRTRSITADDHGSQDGVSGSRGANHTVARVTRESLSGTKRAEPPATNGHFPRKRRKTDEGVISIADAIRPSGNHGPLSLAKPQNRVSPADAPPKSVTVHRVAARRSDRVSQITAQPNPRDRMVTPPPPPPPEPQDTPRTKIRRIKLLVRRPPPLMSNPGQRPPPARCNASITTFLSSYTTVNGQDLDPKTVNIQAKKEAILLERVDSMRRQGRYVPSIEYDEAELSADIATNANLKRPTSDAWDDCIEDVIAYGQQTKSKRGLGRQIAGQIAGKVKAYWDGQAAKQDKAKTQEERKLRALVKATIKMVTAEWKKAVFHIREQERLRLEAEEVKRGHEHLDAILNQSGYILETQHGDLSRGDLSRSRSSSVSANMRDWGSDEEDDEEEGVDEDDEGDKQEEGDWDEDEEEADAGSDDGTSRLLDNLLSPQVHTETSESVTTPPTDNSGPGTPPHLEDVDDLIDDGSSAIAVDELMFATPPTSRPSSPNPTKYTGDPGQEYTPLSAADEDDDSSDQPPDTPVPLSPLRVNAKVPDVDEVIFDDLAGRRVERIVPDSKHPDLLHLGAATATSPTPVTVDNMPHEYIGEDDEPLQLPENSPAVHHGTSSPTVHTDEVLPRLDSEHVTEDDSHSGVVAASIATQQPPSHMDIDMPEEPANVLPMDEDGTVSQTQRAHQDRIAQDIDASGEPLSPAATDHGSNTAGAPEEEQDVDDFVETADARIPGYLKPFSVAPVDWDPEARVKPPLLLRGVLRPYQQSGLEWLASLHVNNLNGILADEMGLGKTIQTISLLAHLACDRGIWGPHLIIVPTSVLLNWEMEFKKFLPGFKILSYHGTTKRRKELRQGWNDKNHFNVCITSYTLASRDAHIFKRKSWYYMILDEAHMIKNFKSQRWNILLMFRSFRRLLLTGTPLQNNLTELWALLQFLMSGSNFANLKEFGEWFSNPLEKAIELGNALDDEMMQRVSKLHTVLRPYLLRRLKRDVEKELPSKYEHLVLCPLSKRQRFLYDEFMTRAHTRDALQSGVYQKIANILMQLRKVCNHPDLFEVRPIVTSFAVERSAIADFEIHELLVRRQFLKDEEEHVNLGLLGLQFSDQQNTSLLTAIESRRLDATSLLPFFNEKSGDPPPKDTRTVAGFRNFTSWQRRANMIAHWSHVGYVNRHRIQASPIYSLETIKMAERFYKPLLPLSDLDMRTSYLDTVQLVHSAVKSYSSRATQMINILDKFAFVTPAVVARDMPRIALPGQEALMQNQGADFDAVLHRASVKLTIAFPDPSLLQYDCGKLQELTRLLREKKAGGHRVLIFTQMTKILDILEIFLNFHGYLYLRLDGATKIEDRQYITERFNADSRVFCFIASSRSGGVGINLTGADTVVFYDSDFNPQMDRQCEDRAHRIGQIRDVHIYRFVSQHTVEEALLRKANQKRSLDELVIQKGEFDWRSLFNDETALTKALGEFEDTEDAHAAAVAAREEVVMEGADEADFGGGDVDLEGGGSGDAGRAEEAEPRPGDLSQPAISANVLGQEVVEGEDDDDEEGGTIAEYMISFVNRDYEFFRDWKL